MSGVLAYPVLAGGEVWPEGTARSDRGAGAIPDGPWWSDFDPDAKDATDDAPDATDDAPDATDDAPDAPFDPAGHTIDEVLGYLGLTEGGQHLTADELSRVLAAEADGKARKTLLDALGAVDLTTYGQPAGDAQS